MLQLLNRSYEARFLGCHALTSAVTGDVLTRLVSELPTVDHSKINDCCTVLCCASGLIVTRRANVDSNDQHAHPSVLRVTLNDILFCQVDKKKLDVTVWVVRNLKAQNVTAVEENGDDVSLNVYIYKCSDASDALCLFQVYNDMSQQAKLQRINRRSAISSVTSPIETAPAGDGWNSITDGIENEHQNAGLIRRKDREMKAAMLEELRDTLRQRYGFDMTSASEVTPKKPLKDVSNMCNNRQRKPARVLEGGKGGEAEVKNTDKSVNADKSVTVVEEEPNLIMVSPSVTASKTPFQFPRSMGDIMKRLVNKNGKTGDVIMKSGSLPNINNATATQPERKTEFKKKKKKKAPLPPIEFEPEPVRIPNRINNLTEPYFYVSSPLTVNEETNHFSDSLTAGSNAGHLSSPTWVHHKQVIKDINLTRNVSVTKRMNSGVKKKIHGQTPSWRANKSNNNKKKLEVEAYRMMGVTAPSIFIRSSSTTSNGSSSSESGPESKLLRSVMKKPKQTNDYGHQTGASNESKKNVTFHAYATVQVLP